MSSQQQFGIGLLPGDAHYRAYVGPPEKYDLVAAMQFNLLTHGLREHHKLLDVGCGSLRLGRLMIPYLRPGCYFGVEPNAWLVEEGIAQECGADQIRIKRPQFLHCNNFAFDRLGTTFDYLIAQSIFSHASIAQIKTAFASAAAVMRAESQFFATYVQGDDDYLGDEWVYPGCCAYRAETLPNLAAQFGLQTRHIDWNHPNGQKWLRLSKCGSPA